MGSSLKKFEKLSEIGTKFIGLEFLSTTTFWDKLIEEGYIEYGNIENCNIKFEVK